MNHDNQPTHILFFIKTTDQKDAETGFRKGHWTRIGAGWPRKDGRINIVRDFMPLTDGVEQLVPIELLDKNRVVKA
jgi:hypothetical protein